MHGSCNPKAMHCINQILSLLQAELTRCGDALARCQGERDALQGQISNDAQVVEDKQALEDAVKKQVGLKRGVDSPLQEAEASVRPCRLCCLGAARTCQAWPCTPQ